MVAPATGGASPILISHYMRRRRTGPRILLAYYPGTCWGTFSKGPLTRPIDKASFWDSKIKPSSSMVIKLSSPNTGREEVRGYLRHQPVPPSNRWNIHDTWDTRYSQTWPLSFSSLKPPVGRKEIRVFGFLYIISKITRKKPKHSEAIFADGAVAPTLR